MIEHGYGRPVASVVLTPKEMLADLPAGALDLNMEGWQHNRLQWYEAQIEAGRIRNLGPTYEASQQFFIIPRRAAEDCSVELLYRDDLLRFSERNPRLALALSQQVFRRMVGVQNRMEDLVFKRVHTRLSRTLLDLMERHGQREARGIALGFPITHQELANMIGSTRETTTAALGDLERQGLIDKRARSARGLFVRDPEGLRARGHQA